MVEKTSGEASWEKRGLELGTGEQAYSKSMKRIWGERNRAEKSTESSWNDFGMCL